MSDSPSPSPSESRAGAYGFTRREIIALAAIVLGSVALSVYAHWRERERQSQATWVMGDVLVGETTVDASGSPAPEYEDSTSLYESRTSTPPRSNLIDMNTAGVRELVRLPGIGAELARRIIEEREKRGAFVDLKDLENVRGIGPKRAAMLSGWVSFSKPITDTTGHP